MVSCRLHGRHPRSLPEGGGSRNEPPGSGGDDRGRRGVSGRLAARVLTVVAVTIAAAGTVEGIAAAQGRAAPPAPDPRTLALEVGPIDISLGELTREFHRAARSDTSSLTPDLNGVERFLPRYRDMLLLQAWALQDTSFLSDADRFGFVDTEWGLLQEAVKNHLIGNYIQSDEAAIRGVYDRMAVQLKVATIRVPTLVELDSAQAALARGLSFADAARRYSKEPATAARGGELGWISAAKIPIDVQERLWSAEIGVVVGPVADRQFHTLFKILDRRPGPPLRSFEEEKPDIVRGVYVLETGRAGVKMHDDLMARYHYRVDPAAAEWMRAFLERETATARRQFDPKVDKPFTQLGKTTDGPFWKEAPLTGDDALRPVATIDGDTLSAIEVIDELVFRPTLLWPTFEKVDDINELCDSAFYQRVLVREARRLGLDRRPDYLEQYWDRRRRFLWRIWRNRYIVEQVAPSENELRTLYDAQMERWDVPERRRFVLVSANAQAVAEEAAGMLREGYAPSTIVRSLEGPSINFEVTPDTTDGWYTRGRLHEPLETAVFGLEAGTVSAVMNERGRYTVLRVEEVSPARTLTFAEASTGLKTKLIQQREKEATKDLLAKATAKFPVTVHHDVIERMDIDQTPFNARRPQRPRP